MTDNVLKIKPIDGDFSLKATIYNALKDAIVKINIYDDNADLRLDERSVSEQFGISRTPLREALAKLEQEGLVKVIPRRGVYIVRKSKDEILDMILVWAAVESMAARLVTEVATDAEIASLRKIVNQVERDQAPAHIDEYSDSNVRFHQAILRLSRSEELLRVANQLFMHVRAIRTRSMAEDNRVNRSIVDHMEIVEAIEARHTERAERLVREHTLNLRAHVAAHFVAAHLDAAASDDVALTPAADG